MLLIQSGCKISFSKSCYLCRFKRIRILDNIYSRFISFFINLERDAQNIQIENDKDKANFGNICVMLRGYRMVADASEAMLINEDVLKDDDGNFYQKIETEEPNDNSQVKQE